MCIGDVGYLTDQGRFRTMFNIFQTAEQNIKCGYDVPKGFLPCNGNIAALESNSLLVTRERPATQDQVIRKIGFVKTTW